MKTFVVEKEVRVNQELYAKDEKFREHVEGEFQYLLGKALIAKAEELKTFHVLYPVACDVDNSKYYEHRITKKVVIVNLDEFLRILESRGLLSLKQIYRNGVEMSVSELLKEELNEGQQG